MSLIKQRGVDMLKKKKSIIFILLVAFLFISATCVVASDKNLYLPREVKTEYTDSFYNKADKEAKSFKLLSIAYQDFNFKSYDEFLNSTLGEPLEMHTLSSEMLKEYKPGDRVKDMLIDWNRLKFPVMVNENVTNSFELKYSDTEGWKRASFGGQSTAKSLFKARDIIPELLQGRIVEKEYTVKLINFFLPIGEYYLYVEAGNMEYMMPILAFPEEIGLENFKLYKPEEILPKVKNYWLDVLTEYAN